nr:ATP synthase F0 subunit 8 [Eirene ceylonensis]
MSQLDISIFYSHLFGLLLTLYIFSHFAVIIITNYYYNNKVRNIEVLIDESKSKEANNINTLMKILE